MKSEGRWQKSKRFIGLRQARANHHCMEWLDDWVSALWGSRIKVVDICIGWPQIVWLDESLLTFEREQLGRAEVLSKMSPLHVALFFSICFS